ncbi:hypothetical protein NKH81_34435 [Mesorhizobium sp. M0959]|uniref:hypothetical protein n=1 Tax=Mesorhizobium sp. M0959 TaxID=2957034 RepID=UPI00333D4362
MKIDLSPVLIDRFEQTIQASRALNYMLFCTHLHNEPLNKDSDGINTLFETQIDLFEGILATIEADLARQRAKPASHETQPSSPEELREKFIADHSRRGVGVPALAQALNMKEAAVAKLVEQLLGTDSKNEKIGLRPHQVERSAVNE